VYLIGIALFGILSGGKQKSSKDYFLSEASVPWLAVCFSIVATETSALTFLSIPGIAYLGNFNFLQVAFGYIIGRVLVAWLILPRYFEGELETAYTFLERRFSTRMRKVASITFMGTRTFADGVRLYTTAIPLALLLQGYDVLPAGSDTEFYIISISVLSALTLVYVFFGGVRAVIWTDVAQLFLYIAGAVISIWVLWDALPHVFDSIASSDALREKIRVLNVGSFDNSFGFFSQPYTLAASVLGGMFLSMASHGTDHLIIQRVLATNNLQKAKRAMVLSGIIVLGQFLLFLFVGTLLFMFYGGAELSANEVFAKFILEQLPSGLSGLIFAGILAAAMSTLSGSISALSSATMLDIFFPFQKVRRSEATLLRWSRVVSVAWCTVLVFVAMLFIQTPKTVVELALSIASYTYGGLLGAFLLGILFKNVKERAAITGFVCGLIGMAVVILFTSIAWTWYTLIGASITIAIGFLSESIFKNVDREVKL